jgi:hypothetical protein
VLVVEPREYACLAKDWTLSDPPILLVPVSKGSTASPDGEKLIIIAAEIVSR